VRWRPAWHSPPASLDATRLSAESGVLRQVYRRIDVDVYRKSTGDPRPGARIWAVTAATSNVIEGAE